MTHDYLKIVEIHSIMIIDIETEYKLKSYDHHNSSSSDLEHNHDDEEHPSGERRPSLLNENARRLLILGTIRPSKTFYKDLPEADVEYLMEYFRRMKITNQKMYIRRNKSRIKNKIY